MTSNAIPALIVRRPPLDFSAGFQRRWNGGDAFMTSFCDALSMSFPVGERYFINAVMSGTKRLGHEPDAESLLLAVRLFTGQEAMHTQLHLRYNEQLERQGFHNRIGPRAERRFSRLQRLVGYLGMDAVLHNLAVTAALEHFTAMLGDLVLSRRDQPGDMFANAVEPLQTLWRWHAAEEAEHKAIAFDLYQRLGGGSYRRVSIFILTTLILLAEVSRQTVNNLWHDRALFAPATWRSGWHFVFGRYGLLRFSWPYLRAYLRRHFHPNQLGHDEWAHGWLATHASGWSVNWRTQRDTPA